MRNSPVSTEVREGRRGGAAPHIRSEIPQQPLEKAMVEKDPGRTCGLWGLCTGAGERCEEEGGQRWTVMDWPKIPFPIPLCCSGVERR